MNILEKHPRVSGEYTANLVNVASTKETPPRERGIHSVDSRMYESVGNTPA